MKYQREVRDLKAAGSLPLRGAWIEMSRIKTGYLPILSLPLRGAWIEIAAVSELILVEA